MLNIDGLEIEVHKGDTEMFTITFTGDDAPADGEKVLVSLKKSVDSENVIWEKLLTVSEGKITVGLTSEETNIPYGQYWWDARILYDDDTVFTPMNPASFKVLGVIGNVV